MGGSYAWIFTQLLPRHSTLLVVEADARLQRTEASEFLGDAGAIRSFLVWN